MKTKNLFIVPLLLIISTASFAGNLSNTDFKFSCRSTGIPIFGGNTMPSGEQWILHFSPREHKTGVRSNPYDLTVEKVNTSTGQILEPSRSGLVKMLFFKAGSNNDSDISYGDNISFIALNGPNFDQKTGRFTSFSINAVDDATLLSVPFVMYGHSLVPKTEVTAISYLCNIESILE